MSGPLSAEEIRRGRRWLAAIRTAAQDLGFSEVPYAVARQADLLPRAFALVQEHHGATLDDLQVAGLLCRAAAAEVLPGQTVDRMLLAVDRRAGELLLDLELGGPL